MTHSQWVRQGADNSSPSVIRRSCGGLPTQGELLKPDGSCCAKTCGCWCIAIIIYARTDTYVTGSCDLCYTGSVYNVEGLAPLGAPCYNVDGNLGLGPGDTVTFRPIWGNISCTASGPTPLVTFTLAITGTWVLYYSDSKFDVYANMTFQNSGTKCNGTPCINTSSGNPFVRPNMPIASSTPANCVDTGPCLTGVNVAHRHAPASPDGYTCNTCVPCDQLVVGTGPPCFCGQYGAMCGAVIVCPNIIQTPFAPDYVPRNDT